MMLREPAAIPPEPGVYALVNRQRRFAYVAYTQNLQKRSHSMSHMLMNYDRSRKAYWPIKELPKHPSAEFIFIVIVRGTTPDRALATIAKVQRGFLARKYGIIGGYRAGSPVIKLNGRAQSIAEAVRHRLKSDPDLKYPTVYRRLQRGWSVKQALGIEPPDPRWDHTKQAERRKRLAA